MRKAVFIQRMGPTMASYRYRAQIPAQTIGASVNGGEAEVLIFSKPTPDDIALAKESKAEGIKIVADFGDDHFRHPTWGPIYAEMAKLADVLVTPTENMSGRLFKYVGRHANAIIPDPYEQALTPPHASEASKFLWFGHAVNLKELTPWLPQLNHLPVTIVATENHGLAHDYVRWSMESEARELRTANIVLLPTRKGVEYKSPNRLVNALRAGCFPVCGDHIPSYREFRKVAWVGNFTTGIKWAQHCRHHLDDLVAEGQQYIEKFSPAAVGALWRQVIEAA